MSTTFDLAIEPLEDLDAPSFSDFEAGVAVGLAIVGLALAAT
jgi:hypothetical protein